MEAALDCVVAIDHQGRILEFNPAAEQTFGRARADVIGHEMAQLLIPPAYREQHARGFARYLATGVATVMNRRLELVGMRADGTEFPVELTVARLPDTNPPVFMAFMRDITEAVAAKEALRASEERYRHLVETSHDLIWAMDQNGRITYVNAAAKRIFDREPSEMVGRLFYDFAPSDQYERDLGAFSEAIRGGRETVEFTSTLHHADGSLITLLTNARVLRDSRGRVRGTTGISRDVTESLRAEAALRQSNERFELVGRATNDAVWDWDFEADTVWWNDGFCTLFGYHPEDIEPGVDSWTSRIHPLDLAGIKKSIQDAIGTRRYWEAEYRFRRSDGTYAYVFDRGYVIHDDQGKPIRMIGAMMDVSARKRAEEQLAQLAMHLNEVFWLTDAATREVLYVSPAYETIWGRPTNLRTIAASWQDTVHPDDRARVAASLSKQSEGGYDEEYRIVRPDGSIRWIRDQAFPIGDEAGQVYRIAGVAADITERRRLEDQLLQSQKMEAVGQLSGGVAHDFNNILTIISGNAAMLQSEMGPNAPVEQLQEIIHAVERGANLTRQLLTFSRKNVMQPASVDLGEIVSRSIKMLHRLLGEDIAVLSDHAPNLPPVHADSGMMEQVLLNLAVNARDAMPDGGTLRIEIAEVVAGGEHGDSSPGTHVRLRVTDTGHGIPPEILPRVFEPFFTTKEPGKGTGLGLATVYGIVKQHRGWVEVDSTMERGTSVSVFLPAVHPDVATAGGPVGAKQSARPSGSETILVVEDEPAVRALAARLLRKSGYRVLEAESGVAALDVWKEHRNDIDLLLTDLVMPGGINGHELAGKLRADKPSLKAIYASGYSADTVDRDQQLVEGVTFLQKPYSADALAQAVRHCLDTPEC